MKSESQDSWVLYSERALDTLCICGLRGRPSRGCLDAQYKYQAVDDLEVVLNRSVFEGVVESITQGDLDILRAAITQYIFTYGYDTQRVSKELLDESSEELYIAITPKDIRELLLLDRDDLPTRQITRSLQKLSSFEVQANYRLRLEGKADPVPIQGKLFNLHIASSKASSRSVEEYMLSFDTEWGKMFIHNVRCGNLVHIQNIPYQDLDNTAKSLFFPIMAMSHDTFLRRQNKLLALLHNGDGQNLPRAVARIESKLDVLKKHGLLTWRLEGRTYHIHRLYDPKTGNMPTSAFKDEEPVKQGKLETEVAEKPKEESKTQDIGNMIIHLLRLESPSDWEQIQCEVIESIAFVNERLEGCKPDLHHEMKPALLRRCYKECSPYYLWTKDEFRSQHEVVEQAFKYGRADMREAFNRIDNDPKLQHDLKEWVNSVESFCHSYLT